MSPQNLTCKQAYEQCDASGQLYGQVGDADLRRFKDILSFVDAAATGEAYVLEDGLCREADDEWSL